MVLFQNVLCLDSLWIALEASGEAACYTEYIGCFTSDYSEINPVLMCEVGNQLHFVLDNHQVGLKPFFG